jgi:peptidoglycan/xylan/chitin deacetylase (PgdA/CDA1 family)
VNRGSRRSQEQSPVKSVIKAAARTADRLGARYYNRLFGEAPALISLAFHTLWEDDDEPRRHGLYPHEGVTVARFRRIVEYFLGHGFRFVSDLQVASGLDPRRGHALISFDDGYRSNLRVLPLLEEYRVPALFFVTTDHVRQGKAFWWDAHYRLGRRAGASEGALAAEREGLSPLPGDAIERALRLRFGDQASAPAGDLDRPLSPAELRGLARHPWARVGNHTASHARLTGCADADIRREVAGAQAFIRDLTGEAPISIAYPSGRVSPRVLAALSGLGLRLGFTTVGRRQRLPLRGTTTRLRLPRFMVAGDPDTDPEQQCAGFRSGVHLQAGLGELRGWLAPGRDQGVPA